MGFSNLISADGGVSNAFITGTGSARASNAREGALDICFCHGGGSIGYI